MASNHYVNNKDFLKALTEYRVAYFKKLKETEEGQKPDIKIPDYVGICILQIAQNLAKKPNFSGYDFVDEMIYDAVFNSLEYAHKFDPLKSDNPFAYFTQITYYAFLRRIDKEKKKLYVQLKMQEAASMELEADPNFKGQQIQSQSEQLFHDGMAEFIEKFEQKNKSLKIKKYPKNPLSDLIDNL